MPHARCSPLAHGDLERLRAHDIVEDIVAQHLFKVLCDLGEVLVVRIREGPPDVGTSILCGFFAAGASLVLEVPALRFIAELSVAV